MSDSHEERPIDLAGRVHELGDRLTKLEVQRQHDVESMQVMLVQQSQALAKLDVLTTKLTILETERKVIVGISGVLGALIALVLEGLLRWIVPKA